MLSTPVLGCSILSCMSGGLNRGATPDNRNGFHKPETAEKQAASVLLVEIDVLDHCFLSKSTWHRRK